jgi:hypothetical protein
MDVIHDLSSTGKLEKAAELPTSSSPQIPHVQSTHQGRMCTTFQNRARRDTYSWQNHATKINRILSGLTSEIMNLGIKLQAYIVIISHSPVLYNL